MNEIHIDGTLGKDSVRNGNGPFKFSLAHGGGKKKNSDERYPTEWHEVICWPDRETQDCQAEGLKKGQRVEVHGRIKVETWTDKETGKPRSKVVIVADEITRQLEAKTRESRPVPKQPESKPEFQSFEITDEDIPF